jgi:hypothetical protein
MCDDRERLIGYVYDECDAHERREIQAHLAECSECRTEIGALRAVRQDLLAWEVPARESVWRPFVAPRPVFSVRDIPTWALAAAASLVVASGIVGSALTYAVMPRQPAPVQAVAVAPAAPIATPAAPIVSPAAVSAADLSALEARVMKRLSDMDTRLRLVAAHAPESEVVHASTTTAHDEEMRRQMAALRRSQIESLSSVNADLQRLYSKQRMLEQGQGLMLTSLVRQQSDAQGGPR